MGKEDEAPEGRGNNERSEEPFLVLLSSRRSLVLRNDGEENLGVGDCNGKKDEERDGQELLPMEPLFSSPGNGANAGVRCWVWSAIERRLGRCFFSVGSICGSGQNAHTCMIS